MEEDEDVNKVFIFAGFPADKAKEKEELVAKWGSSKINVPDPPFLLASW